MQWYCFDMCCYKKMPIITELKQFEVFSNIYSKNKYNYLYICIVKQHFCATFLRFAGGKILRSDQIMRNRFRKFTRDIEDWIAKRTRILLTANLCTVNAFANNFSSLVKQHIRRSSIIWCIYMLCKKKSGLVHYLSFFNFTCM